MSGGTVDEAQWRDRADQAWRKWRRAGSRGMAAALYMPDRERHLAFSQRTKRLFEALRARAAMSSSEPTAAEALRARHRAAARRNAGRHRAAAARYVPDYQERHLSFTERALAAEAKAKAAAAKPKCACCGGTGIAGGGTGGGTGTAGMAAASVLAGAATGGMLAADMHHD